MDIRNLQDTDFAPQIAGYIRVLWGGTTIVTLGQAHDAGQLPGLVAVEDGVLMGALLYRMDADTCEVMVLFSLAPGYGAGSALLRAVEEIAMAAGKRRLWLVTTNDNTAAIRFYQRRGFSLRAAHIGSFEQVRALKGELPALGIDGIPLEHELEFERRLDQAK